jgi:hypothetical protein
MTLPPSSQLRLGVVARGAGLLTVDDFSIGLKPGACFLLAASAPPGSLTVASGEPLQILFCLPGRRD